MRLALAAAAACIIWLTACTIGSEEIPWDDNFISYIYSRNVAAGHGFRYNATDPSPTEGFSSLTHVVLVAAGFKLGLDPLLATRLIGSLFFLLIPATLGLSLARLLRLPAAVPLLITCAAQFLLYLTPATPYHLNLGMETIIFMGSIAWLAGWSLRELGSETGPTRAAAWRVVSGCGAVIVVACGRPEGPLLVTLTLAVVYLARRFLLRDLRFRNDRAFLLVAGWAAIGLVFYLSWKKWYFGDILPNPYYVKTNNAIMGMKVSHFPGWHNVREFFRLVAPWCAAALPLAFLARRQPGFRNALLIAALPGACMVVLYAKVIHEAAFLYRYEYPYLVFLIIPLCGLACLAASRFRAAPLVLCLVIMAAVFLTPNLRKSLTHSPAAFLTVRAGFPGALFLVVVGQDLARTRLGSQATIALSAAGAIPYFSGFRAIDLLGLNDPFLCGRKPHSIAEVWQYIESFRPDVLQSMLPPATPGFGIDQFDPVLGAPVITATLGGAFGSDLPGYWDRGKLLELMRREMMYIRDHYTFGAIYDNKGGGWTILYLRRDSPYREHIRSTLQSYSFLMDRLTDVSRLFLNDPRRL